MCNFVGDFAQPSLGVFLMEPPRLSMTWPSARGTMERPAPGTRAFGRWPPLMSRCYTCTVCLSVGYTVRTLIPKRSSSFDAARHRPPANLNGRQVRLSRSLSRLSRLSHLSCLSCLSRAVINRVGNCVPLAFLRTETRR